MEFPILIRGHYKDTVERYDIETLFIIIERYVKLYIFDCDEIVHDRAMAICVIAIEAFSRVWFHFYGSLQHNKNLAESNIRKPYNKAALSKCVYTCLISFIILLVL